MLSRIILFVCSVISVLCGACLAEEPAAGVIAVVEGSADILRSGQTLKAAQYDIVNINDRIRTKNYSRVEIVLNDKSVIRLAASSCIKVDEFVLNEKTAREKAAITLSRGMAQVTISKSGRADTFTLNTPNASGVVKGTDVFMSYLSGQTGVLVKEGRMAVCNIALPGDVVTVNKGATVTVPFTSAPTPARPYLDAEFLRYKSEVSLPEKKTVSMRDIKEMNGAVTQVSGGVRIYKRGETEGRNAAIDETVAEGDKIVTAQDGKIEVRLTNGNIISLQPSSEITFARMVIDPESGEYDNTFESNFGEIMAVVEKIDKKSTFQIRSPVAVSGVRGTVLYVNIQQSGTTAYYEGGYGVVTSLLTGESQIVEPGRNSMVQPNGIITIPVITSNEQRLELNQAWKGDKVIEENSSGTMPLMKGTKGIEPFLGPGPGQKPEAWAANVGGDKIQGAFLPEVYDKLTYIELTRQTAGTFVPNSSFAGKFGTVGVSAGTASFGNQNGELTGKFHFPRDGNYSSWLGNENGSLTGSYSNINPLAYYLFDTTHQCVADDGGRYKGWIRGVMINGKILAQAVSIDIDPTGHAGTLSAYFDGPYNTSTKTFTVSDINNVKMSTWEFLGILPGDLFSLSILPTAFSGRGAGTMGGGTISCNAPVTGEGVNGTFHNISGLTWGVWTIDMKGTWSSPANNTWTLPLAGVHNLVNPGDGVWLGTANGNTWSASTISGNYKGIWLSKTNDIIGDEHVTGGIMDKGRIVGHYTSGPDSWEAVGGGDWVQRTAELTESGMGFTMADLKTFVSIPITEVASFTNAGANALNGPAIGSTANFTPGVSSMDIAFYENPANRIWTGNVAGWFSGSMPSSWTLNMASGSDCDVTLTGNSWADGKWHAYVANGTNLPTGVTGFSGEAGGSYEPDGSFDGIAAGTWAN